MRVVAMVSGGKDSCYNMMQCVAEGHEIVALANLHPKDRDELDSYMYQTVGHMGIEILAKAMGLPLYRRETKGISTQTGKHYVPTDDDEVEDLYNLLEECKQDFNIEAVAVGAILSDYQRVRVENVCSRLNLVSLAYLWRRDQTELLQEMIDCQVHAIIIKVATLGLVPDRHLGKSLREIQPHLIKMHDKYGLNVCGEGGEYETFTLDCPLFKQRIVVDDVQTIISSADPICPVGYINFTKISLQTKEHTHNCDVFVKRSLDYISDLNESTYSDLSDPDLSETELELIEKETRMRESLSQNELISRSNSFGRHLTSSSSPIPIVTKSASVDEPTPSIIALSAAAVSASLQTASSFGIGNRALGGSSAAVCGSLSLAVSSTGATAGGISAAVALTQPPSPMKFEREFRPLTNRPMAAINQKGWMWVAGIQGCAPTLEEGMQKALDFLHSIALDHNYDMTDYCYVTLYVRSIADYPTLNHIYGQAMHFQNPPTRVCVECPLPEECHVVMEAIAFRAPTRRRPTLSITLNEVDGNLDEHNASTSMDALAMLAKRHTMHVQGISHWAPANIGPYSQSTKVGEITYISGQIALVPGSMTIIDGGIRPQCKLALRHISRIAKAMNAQGQLRDVVHGICFVTHPAFIAEARRQWERRTTNAIMDFIVVPALPREALVEWQVWAHTQNDRFEYEETGCSVGDYTISIRRRWNYENNCAAIVCYVSTERSIFQSTWFLVTYVSYIPYSLRTSLVNEKLSKVLLSEFAVRKSIVRFVNLHKYGSLLDRLASSTTQLTQLSEDVLNNHARLAQNLSAENADEIFTYVVNRLLKDYPIAKRFTEPCHLTSNDECNKSNEDELPKATTNNTYLNIPAIHLKVFYQVNASPSVELLLNSLLEFRTKCAETVDIVYTVLPACSLHNFSTFLSICGVRHE